MSYAWYIPSVAEKLNYCDSVPEDNFSFFPIGFLRTLESERYELPRQPIPECGCSAIVELLAHSNFEQALEDLVGFSRIWLIFSFHRNTCWRPKVRPPRGDRKRGVFATRSPHRPNSIGMSAVPLLGVEGRRIFIGEHDILDGSPILDIKPYVVYADSFPAANQGWLTSLDEESRYTLSWSPWAQSQREYLLVDWGIDLERTVRHCLQTRPHPTKSNRVRKVDVDIYELAAKSWRLTYRVKGALVEVLEISSGYSENALEGTDDPWEDMDSHRAFVKHFLPYPCAHPIPYKSF